MSSKILITGGTGLVGTRLSEKLAQMGHQVTHLSRRANPHAKFPAFKWDIEKGEIDPKALEVDHIIHLAGAGVGDQKWTERRKKVIYDSRIDSTKLLHDKVKEAGISLKSFLSASAIGYYGMDTGDQLLAEDSPGANDFLAQVTADWEKAAEGFEELNIPLIYLRIGVVFSSKGGALVKMAQPVRFGVGAALGSGKQYISWIHIDDICAMIIWLLENKKEGIYNGVAPNPKTNSEVTKAIAQTLKRPLFLPPVPAFVLKMMLGEMSSIAQGGNKVSAQKLVDEGFEFQFNDIRSALSDIYEKGV
ncbi:MAG: TIGR01777 family oxidoreductase [Cytophagales bacterium]|nr:TIGR01777 family oxidoreductase [Cytophagales bacterium]